MRRPRAIILAALAGAAVGIALGVLAGTTGLFSGSASQPQGPFDWFQSGQAPAAWKQLALPSGAAVLSYPPAFRRGRSDPGTVAAKLADRSGTIVGYLNATPKQGNETLANWPEFRVDHQHEEGVTQVVEEAKGFGLAFRGGTGTCVVDRYLTAAKTNRYREIACYVVGKSHASVIVAAGLLTRWNDTVEQLRQAVSAYAVT